MDCKLARELITLYIDDNLDEIRKRDMEAHLGECRECYNRFKEINEVVTLVRNLGQEDVPDGFSERLHIRLEAERQARYQQKPKRARYWIKWMGMASAVALIVFSLRLLGVLNLQSLSTVGINSRTVSDSTESMVMEDGRLEASESAGAEDELAGYVQEAPLESEEPSDQSGHGELAQSGDDAGKKGGMPKEIDTGISLEESVGEDDVDAIKSDVVELEVQDICVTPQTLMTKALQYGISVIDVAERDITLQFTDEEQRKLIYRELKMLGTVRDVGTDFSSDTVSIIIIHDE
ncbi:MAG: hypothetical protein GX094_05160 [Clostridiales bacterium]|jgi:hypothetical protein|nr:hypothetical protein [Clostridiales bacterium]